MSNAFTPSSGQPCAPSLGNTGECGGGGGGPFRPPITLTDATSTCSSCGANCGGGDGRRAVAALMVVRRWRHDRRWRCLAAVLTLRPSPAAAGRRPVICPTAVQSALAVVAQAEATVAARAAVMVAGVAVQAAAGPGGGFNPPPIARGGGGVRRLPVICPWTARSAPSVAAALAEVALAEVVVEAAPEVVAQAEVAAALAVVGVAPAVAMAVEVAVAEAVVVARWQAWRRSLAAVSGPPPIARGGGAQLWSPGLILNRFGGGDDALYRAAAMPAVASRRPCRLLSVSTGGCNSLGGNCVINPANGNLLLQLAPPAGDPFYIAARAFLQQPATRTTSPGGGQRLEPHVQAQGAVVPAGAAARPLAAWARAQPRLSSPAPARLTATPAMRAAATRRPPPGSGAINSLYALPSFAGFTETAPDGTAYVYGAAAA